MAKKIEGIDVSHWNQITTIDDFEPEFVIIKLTEGKTFSDNQAGLHYAKATMRGAQTGFYHFARAEKNDAIEEAEWFVNNLPKGAIGKSILVLDYEAKALSITSPDDWALRWLTRVEQLTGVKPLLYCSQSVVRRFPKTQANGNGLWVARYRNKLLGYGDVTPWKFAAIWQYTSKPVDRDIFYGTVEQFQKYAKIGGK